MRHAEASRGPRRLFPGDAELRPHLADAREFLSRVRRQFAEGYRLLAAWRDAQPLGLAGYRRAGEPDPRAVLLCRRSGGRGVGAARALGARLLDAVGGEARALGITRLVLDTAIDNVLGQRFYFRYGMLPAGAALRDAAGLRSQ